MAATKIGIICEGPIDFLLLNPLLQRIAYDRAQFHWPLQSGDVAEIFPIRKRGHGGVLEAVRRVVKVMKRSNGSPEYAFFLIVLDQRTKPVQSKIKPLIRGNDRFVLAIANKEIEAWWLGDRVTTLAWLQLTNSLPSAVRYASRGYKAETDDRPKGTLDELTEISSAVEYRYGAGNSQLAADFAEIWANSARLRDIEAQCPQGFEPFCRSSTNALKRAKARTGRLF